jgi:hypothetical protein
MHGLLSGLRVSLAMLLLAAVAGCSGIAVPGFGSSTPAAETPATPPTSMAGRWLLSSPGRGQCVMTFGAATPNATEGTIAPQGGCAGKFFTSRRWDYQQGSLIVRDHNGQPLAQLSGDGAQFNGKATGGEPVTLAH